jgi:hypothetical protein
MMVARDGVEPPPPAFSATLCCSLNNLSDSFRPRMIPRVVASFSKQAFRMPLPMTEDIDVGRICTDLIGQVLSVLAKRVGFES